VKLGAKQDDMVPFEKYAAAAQSLTRPASAARALQNGAPNIERADKLVQLIAPQNGMPRSPQLREREQAPPTVSAADFPICCDDPVPRCARQPAPADIIIDRPDRPSSIVAPNLRTAIR
jgi:hypothetical protein